MLAEVKSSFLVLTLDNELSHMAFALSMVESMINTAHIAAFRSKKAKDARTLAECVRMAKDIVFAAGDDSEAAMAIRCGADLEALMLRPRPVYTAWGVPPLGCWVGGRELQPGCYGW
jgi:hypothetical protein